MSHITLYLDRETESIVRAAARGSRVSVSKWVASAVKRVARRTWPDDVRRMAGTWSDFPSAEELRNSLAEDHLREKI
jgi:hypothetical protein